jgi:hypothetical protein
MALLIYSKRCNKCNDVLTWLESNKQVSQIVRLHDVNANGIPPKYAKKIKAVPTMLTENGKLLVGSEVKAWLISIAPVEEPANYCIGGKCNVYGLDDNLDDGDIFNIDKYGESIQPAITPELSERINATVIDNYQKIQSSFKE